MSYLDNNSLSLRKVHLGECPCALDLGDGSERGLYVNQDYILRKLQKVHRGISLMYTYYPNDKEWPTRACLIDPSKEVKGAWDSPYENYFPYRGGREGLREDEPFCFMKEIRKHGMDVVLSITIDPALKEEDIILIARDLRPYGRVFLRVNHECTGNWFCYNKRATYKQLADFFVMVCKVMHEYAPNVKVILCAGMYEKDTGKIEMEDIFLEAHKACDIWSGDHYLSLHFGWPVDIATKETSNYFCSGDNEVYERAKNTLHRLRKITGQDKPFFLSEMNGDGDVTGAFEQANMMNHFMNCLEKDKEKWLSAFTLYQFRDDGRLGLEITDPNNSEVGIEQPILSVYKKQLHKSFFSQKITKLSEPSCKIEFPVKLRWSNSEDAEGIELDLYLKKIPCYAELYFEDELVPLNLMIEFDGFWFYKASGVKFVDLMSRFYEKPCKIKKGKAKKLRLFAPPQDGLNYPYEKKSPSSKEFDSIENGEWMFNSYTTIPSLPKIRIEYEPVELAKHYSK